MALVVVAFTTPTGNVVPRLQGSDFIATFNVVAQIGASGGDTCGVVEYRQYIKGEMRVGGVLFNKPVGVGRVLSSTTFQEDGQPFPGVPENANPFLNSAYGYRAYGDKRPTEPSRSESYTPNGVTGCRYEMNDAPGFTNVVGGRRHSLNLTFRGVLIDTRSNMELASKAWTVIGEVG